MSDALRDVRPGEPFRPSASTHNALVAEARHSRANRNHSTQGGLRFERRVVVVVLSSQIEGEAGRYNGTAYERSDFAPTGGLSRSEYRSLGTCIVNNTVEIGRSTHLFNPSSEDVSGLGIEVGTNASGKLIIEGIGLAIDECEEESA